jgi:DNA gyrase/topoisomerase IV subunit B
MQELFIKKRKKEKVLKNRQVSEISKIMGTQIPAMKNKKR